MSHRLGDRPLPGDRRQHDADAATLASLGYRSEFRREMSPAANFALGFTYLSPVVGIYTLFAVGLVSGGPAMIWWLVIVGVGQLLVALVFGEVVSQFPVAGGVYPWARRLWGRRWAWMTGWIYLIALLTTIAGVVYGSGPFLAQLLGFTPGTSSTITCALILLALALAINLMGTKWLATAAVVGFSAELMGALAVGWWLLLTERHQSLSVIFETGDVVGHSGGYLSAFMAAALIGIYQYYGFEACGDVAEEVPDPSRQIPKAMRMTIYVGGAAAIFVCLALLLAVSDYARVIDGTDADPVTTILHEAFGETGTKVVLVVVMMSFLSCALSLMAAASRLLYAYARDDMVPGARLFRTFLPGRHVPPYAMVVAAVAPAVIVLGSVFSTKALTSIISFATLGIYLGFHMVTAAALRARLLGWVPSGPFTLGRWGLVVNAAAPAYGVLAMVNMAWPRSPGLPWYDNWLVALSAAIGVGIGGLYLVLARPHERSDALAGDAIPAPVDSDRPSPPAEGAIR
ncbi:APC family permease [Nocardioides abyssi]|uniref:Amino acid permease n=1 Tax=Nocardioides abyssi TaxID=3058370 RepID=A0ABT8EXS8_9ACTN|nr:amino acid permease [Nocardioides abyssi]MDN4162997.1 amino acid permease [Nocardioides abyssi]